MPKKSFDTNCAKNYKKGGGLHFLFTGKEGGVKIRGFCVRSPRVNTKLRFTADERKGNPTR